MTTLHVLGSGSRGNCCAIESEGVALLIDAGFSRREIERRAERAGLDLSLVAGIVLTHEHGDHATGAMRLAGRLGTPILTAPGTWERLTAAPSRNERQVRHPIMHRPLGFSAQAELGPFVISACATSHDAAEPIAVAIRMRDGTSIGVAYDLGRPTAAVRYLLRDLTALVLEANHDDVLLRTSGYPPSVQQRIAGAGGHLSNRAAAELIAELHHPGLSTVVLAHLSQRCNSAEHAIGTVRPALERVRFRGTIHVATQDDPLPPIVVAPRARTQLPLAL